MSLRDLDEQSKSYICPGCLRGRIESLESDEAEVLIDDAEKQEKVILTPKGWQTCTRVPFYS